MRSTWAAEPPEGDGWERDPDVLDTWFSSGLWPFATLGWPEQTDQLRAFYPTDVLTTGRDIIFLWVARMVMLGIEFTGEVPFTDVSINSTIMAPDGRRMSKSLGTGIDPLDEIAEHGADAVRFGLVAMASTQDVRFSADRVRQGLDLANKLWNASRLILLGVPEGVEPSPDLAELPEDRWILSRLERVTERTDRLIAEFELSAAALELYDFFWSELCDWYLEMAKTRLRDGDEAVSATLLYALDRTLRLLHPLMPHVTEEIWSFMPGERGPADRGAVARGRRVAPRRGRGGRGRQRDRRDHRRAPLPRPGRGQALGQAAGPPGAGRGRRAGRADRPAGAAGAGGGGRRWPACRCPAARSSCWPVPTSTPTRRAGGSRASATGSGARSGGWRRSSATPSSWSARPPTWSRASAASSPSTRRPWSGSDVASWTLARAEEYLLGLELFGMHFGLERMHRLTTTLGMPQRRFASVHVVGSNGKSSTVRFTAAVLERHGLRTGSYTSPHLASFRERIEVGEQPVSGERFAAAVERAAKAAEIVERAQPEDEDLVTQFEALTAAAYHELAASKVEVAVIEAGLGGRYDATNVIPSKVAVLTGVGLEHTRWLGPDDRRHRRGEAGRGARPLRAGHRRRWSPPRGPWPSAWPASATRTGSSHRPWSTSRCARRERFSARTSRSPAPPPRRSWAARWTPAPWPTPPPRRGSRAAWTPCPSGRWCSTTAPTTRPARSALAQALPEVLGDAAPARAGGQRARGQGRRGHAGSASGPVRPGGVHALLEPPLAVAGHARVAGRADGRAARARPCRRPPTRSSWRGRWPAPTGPWWSPDRST